MASLGQLTAGIAHEIKNPLNFVNNFAELSRDLLAELKETIGSVTDGVDGGAHSDLAELIATLSGNMSKIAEHGRRADGIAPGHRVTSNTAEVAARQWQPPR